MTQARIAVLGGGYGGVAVAASLDEIADVVLVEPKDAFVHNVAALRGLVDPVWATRMFLPYDRLLRRGTVLRDRVVALDGTRVGLASGERLDADFVVLATGSSYPFPAKIDSDSAAQGRQRLAAAREALAAASSVLLLGAGPAGLELAGEIREAWPDTAITVLDPAPDILPGPMPAEFRAELRGQLDALGVRLLLGTTADPPAAPGPFTVSTSDGRQVAADIWFRCHGVVPNTAYLTGDPARRADGHLEVTAELRLAGHERVFAIGDLTAVPETKLAKAAELHADVVAANIRTLLGGGTELAGYAPAPPGMSLPLGTRGGASYNAEVGLLGAARTAELKGSHLRLEGYRAKLGLAAEYTST